MGRYKLKTCPFCKGKASIEQYGAEARDKIYIADYKVGCKECGIVFKGSLWFTMDGGELSIQSGDLKTAVDRWNRRADT